MNYLFLGSKTLLKTLLHIAPFGSVLTITLGLTIFFGVRAATFAQQQHVYNKYEDDESNYDKRQDDRMDHQDQTITGIQAERKERHDETIEYRLKLEEDHDRIVRDEAYFTGGMGLLAILQIYIKLVRKDPPLPQIRNGIRRNDDRSNDQN